MALTEVQCPNLIILSERSIMQRNWGRRPVWWPGPALYLLRLLTWVKYFWQMIMLLTWFSCFFTPGDCSYWINSTVAYSFTCFPFLKTATAFSTAVHRHIGHCWAKPRHLGHCRLAWGQCPRTMLVQRRMSDHLFTRNRTPLIQK